MSADDDTVTGPFGPISRRSAIGSTLLAGAAFLGGSANRRASGRERTAASAPRKRYDMKKSINLWAFPYPQKMTLVQCLQLAKDAGFDGIELNYDLESDLSPKAGTREFQQIRARRRPDRHRDQRPVLVPVLAVSADEQRPGQARPAASSSPAGWRRPRTTSAWRTCWSCPARCTSRGATTTSRCRTTSATAARAKPSAQLVKTAEKLKVSLNIENIFFNGYLMTPMEMNAFVDSFASPHVRVHFDTGNIMLFQHPEHWIPDPRQADRQHALQGVHQEGHRSLAGIVPAAARRHDQLAGGDGGARGDRLSRLLHVRVLPPVPALSRGADLPDVGLAGSDSGEEGVTRGGYGGTGSQKRSNGGNGEIGEDESADPR